MKFHVHILVICSSGKIYRQSRVKVPVPHLHSLQEIWAVAFTFTCIHCWYMKLNESEHLTEIEAENKAGHRG